MDCICDADEFCPKPKQYIMFTNHKQHSVLLTEHHASKFSRESA